MGKTMHTTGEAPTPQETRGTTRKDPATASKATKPTPKTTDTPPPIGDPTTARAEELVDVIGQRVGRYAAEAGRQLTRLAVRAREEAEDILMEAQHLRGKRP